MNKGVIALFMIFILVVSVAPALIIADEDDNSRKRNSDDNSGSDSVSDSSDSSVVSVQSTDSNDDSSDDDFSKDNSGSGSRERVREEIKRDFVDDEGRRVRIERKVEVEDGKRKIEIKRKITLSDGTVRKIKIKIEERNGRRKVEVEGRERNVSVETELEIESEFEGNASELGVVDSLGERHRIKFLPDQAAEIARERVKAHINNITNITLDEIRKGNIPKVVYKINSEHNGRFLGVFKLKLKAETQVDPETGEIIDVNTPWWAFLVTGEDVPATSTDEADSDNAVAGGGTVEENTTP